MRHEVARMGPGWGPGAEEKWQHQEVLTAAPSSPLVPSLPSPHLSSLLSLSPQIETSQLDGYRMWKVLSLVKTYFSSTSTMEANTIVSRDTPGHVIECPLVEY